MFKLLRRYRYSVILLKQLVKTDFKLRYQGSFLGYLWSLLRPLALFAVLYVVFVKFLPVGKGIPHYPVYLLLGLILWNFFTEVTSGSVGAVVGKGDLLRKLNFPKYIVVVAGSISALINLGINFIVLGVFMWLSGIDVNGAALPLIPLLLLELFVFAIGLAFFLSALYVRYRDVNYVWEVLLQAAFYATPILYSLSLVPERAAKILMLNPMAQIIQDMRHILITPESITLGGLYGNWWIRLVPIMCVIVVALLASVYFKKRSRSFAEEV